MKKILSLFIMASSLVFASQAMALPVSVDYTYTGAPGDYVLDFTLTNNIPAAYNQELYFFGVDLPYNALQGSPGGWASWGNGSSWTNSGYGGSSLAYPSTWISGSPYDVASGDSLSGFKVHASSIPSDIHFYAFAYTGSDYQEDDAFYKGTNPGFEGLVGDSEEAGGTATPEPASMILMGIGLAGAAMRRRK